MRRRYLNGKWLAQAASGTQRYATEVVKAALADRLLDGLTLVVPADAVVPAWAREIPLVRSRLRGAAFEQLALPWLSRRGHLVSLAGPAALLRRDQTVVMHDAMPFRHPETFRRAFVWWYRLMYTVLGRTASRVVTVSEFSRSELAEVLRVPESRFEVAPCGSDHVEPPPATDGATDAPGPRPGHLLVVGNLAPHKNTAPAVAALARAGLPVVVVGGTQDQVFRSAALPRSDRVEFLGRVSDERLSELYANASALVAPSLYEGFGIPVIEAGRLGCPSVVAGGSALQDVVGAGGLVFEPDDLDACVAQARRVLDEPGLQATLSRAARENARRFRWSDAATTVFGHGPTRRARATPEEDGPGPGTAAPRLRVLHVTETFSAGTGSAVVGFAASTIDQGVESSLLAQDRGSGLLGSLPSSPFAHAQIVPSGLLTLWRAVGPALVRTRPDVVHVHSSVAGAVVRVRLALQPTVPVVYSPHCFAFERRDIAGPVRVAYRAAEGVLARVTDAFVCVSPHEAGLAGDVAGKAPVVSLVNVFDALAPSPVGRSRDDADDVWRVASIGRVMPQKEPGLFADVVAELARTVPGARGLWIGSGTDPRGTEALEAVGVEITGWLDADGLGAALAEADAYLHTASWEAGPPIAVLDAIRVGVPVVVRRNAAYAGLLPEAWQFDDRDEAVAMLAELRDPLRRADQARRQHEVLLELEARSPRAVLAPAYRSIAHRGRRRRTTHDEAPDGGRPTQEAGPA